MDRRKFTSLFLIFFLCTLVFLRLGTGLAAADSLDNWHVRTVSASLYGGLGYGNGVFVAVGDAGEILTSADGVTWTARTSGTTENLTAVAYGNGRFMAVGSNGKILRSLDNGATWSAVKTTLNVFLYGITYGNGKFVALGDNQSTYRGIIMTSPDGAVWSTTNLNADEVPWGVAYGNGVFVAVGENYTTGTGYILTSVDGAAWTAKNSGPGESLWGVAYGNGRFLAVGSTTAGGGKILSSNDNGATWVTRSSGLGGIIYLNGIVYGSGMFVAAGQDQASASGLTLTSPDGVTWALRADLGHGSLQAVTYGNGTFVVRCADGTILQSDPLPLLQSLAINNGAAYTANRTVTLTLSAGDPDSATEMQFSQDNVNWSTPEPFNDLKSWTLTEGDGQKYVYVRFKDPLGNWSAPLAAAIILDTQIPVTSAQPPGGTYAGTQLVTLSTSEPLATIFYTLNGTMPTVNSPVYQEPLLINSNRILRYFARDPAGNAGPVKTETYQISTHPLDTWYQRAQDPSVYNLTYGNGIFVVVGDYGAILTSPDGLVWTTSRPSSTLESNLAAVAYASGTFVAVGDSGTILTSADNGATWTSRTMVMTEHLLAVAAGNGKFVALGDAGVMLISSDQGATWTRQSPVTTSYLCGLTYGNGVFVAVGDSGTILTSADSGATWTARNSGVVETLCAIAYGNGKFVAAGDNGMILTSADSGATWTPQTVGGGADIVFNGVAYGSGMFVVVGEKYVAGTLGTGQILTSYDGATWISRTLSGLQDGFLAVVFGEGTFVALSFAGTILQSGSLMGDVNNDQRTDLEDLILYLRVLNGEYPPEVRPDYSLSGIDPDGDGRIGLPDVIFILQKLSGKR